VKLAGYSEVGERCFLGISTTVIDGVKIGDNVQTGAGAVVTKDVRSGVLIAGVPAIIKKELLSNDVGTKNKNEKPIKDGHAKKT
jgi:acetyltransferase-like isoleucine patch superfamily enzyme